MKMTRGGPVLGAAVLALMLAGSAVSQSASQTSKPAASGSPEIGASTFDITLFGGWEWFQAYASNNGRSHRLDDGEVFGMRFNEDFASHFGLEEAFQWGPAHDLKLRPYGGGVTINPPPPGTTPSGNIAATAHTYELALSPLVYFTNRESRIRPYLTAGPGYTWYTVSPNALVGPNGYSYQPHGTNSPAFVYGGGLKIAFNDHFGFRTDFRGMWTKQARFGLPTSPNGPGSLYVGDPGGEQSLSATAGFVFRFGVKHPAPPAPPAPPPPPPPPPPPVNTIALSAVTGARDVCPGEDLQLRVTATANPPDMPLTYQWLVNGQPVPGAGGPTFSVPTQGRAAGNLPITVRVTGGTAQPATSNPVTVRVKSSAPPTIRFVLGQTTITRGDKVPLNATATGSECTDPVAIRYTASEGTITGNTYDSTNVVMDPNVLRLQTKTIVLTAIATDKLGQEARATQNLTITLAPTSRRLEDIVFPLNNARVNNCAKRVLLEELTPLLRDNPGKVIFIGHRDMNERASATPRATVLDEQRVLNSAAVISAGSGICPSLELSRINGNWVAADQTSPTQPNFCGTSTNVKERPGQTVSATDTRAQYRRVEVWFVPDGAALPPGVTAMDLPAAQVTPLGCPR
jgi:opacity protein-like surface antigen